MSLLQLPWVELAIAVAVLGAVCVSLLREPSRAYRWGVAFTGAAFAAAVLAWLRFFQYGAGETPGGLSGQRYLFHRQLFALDQLSAPLFPAVALLHFLTALATTRTKMRRYSFSWSLASESLRLAMFSCQAPWLLIILLILCTVPPYVELVNRDRPTRIYVLHMILFASLLGFGWMTVAVSPHAGTPPVWGTAALLAALLIRCGVAPAHYWMIDWFENASFGNALLFVTPLAGVCAAMRLVLPFAPDWLLACAGPISLATAVYAAGMAIVQRDVRRFFAYLFLSHVSLVLVGLELNTPTSLTGALCLWFSVILSLGGFGLTLRALESRYGRLSLADYHGLYEHTPTLAVCFLLTGLASVGFPFTIGFVSTEMLVDGAVEVNVWLGAAVIAAAALNGIAVVRAYLLLFTGARHLATVLLRVRGRERAAVLTLSALILGGGLIPQPGVQSRSLAAEEILQVRQSMHLVQDPKEETAAALPGEPPVGDR